MFKHVKDKSPSEGTSSFVYSFGEDSHSKRNNKAFAEICLYKSRHA